MQADTDWAHLANTYLAAYPVDGPMAVLIGHLRARHPVQLDEPLSRDAASAAKTSGTHFLLFAIRHAVSDHALSDDEMVALRHLPRLLRLEEGDFLVHHRAAVGELLCQELERLLEDHTIDPQESIHKVRFQELLGLGYDQFVDLTLPEIRKVVIDLMRQLDPSPLHDPSDAEVRWFQRQIAALDTVYDLNRPTSGGGRSGYLYLFINPSMPGLVKIGRTSRKPDHRVGELTSATGVPTPFLLVYEVFVIDTATAETYVRKRLEELGSRVSENREFFNIAPSKAVELMLEAKHALPGT